MSSLPSMSKALAIAAKNYVKAGIKVLLSSPILFDFFALFQIFYPGLSQYICFGFLVCKG